MKRNPFLFYIHDWSYEAGQTLDAYCRIAVYHPSVAQFVRSGITRIRCAEILEVRRLVRHRLIGKSYLILCSEFVFCSLGSPLFSPFGKITRPLLGLFVCPPLLVLVLPTRRPELPVIMLAIPWHRIGTTRFLCLHLRSRAVAGCLRLSAWCQHPMFQIGRGHRRFGLSLQFRELRLSRRR